MKTRRIFLSLALCAALLLGTAHAAGGDAGDPLISLDYLQNIFAPAAESAAREKLDASGKTAYDAAESAWRAAAAAAEASAASEHTAAWTEACLKQGDILSVLTGSQVILLSGEATAQFTDGALVDATDGTELAAGAALQARHRYLAAEDTTALITVSSPTAVLDHVGSYHVTPSDNAPDCFAMASALRALTLFRGTGSGYGEGFDLEDSSTRAQALVMLLRLLGEEDDTLTLRPSIAQGFGNGQRVKTYATKKDGEPLNHAGLMDTMIKLELGWKVCDNVSLSGYVGYSDFLFDRKCVFTIAPKEGVDLEELELELIDYGVEELFAEEDEIVIYAEFQNFGPIQKYLEENNFEIKSFKFERIPNDMKQLTDEDKEEVEKLLEKIEEDDDVTNVFHNME